MRDAGARKERGEAISGDKIKRAKSANDSSFTIKTWMPEMCSRDDAAMIRST